MAALKRQREGVSSSRAIIAEISAGGWPNGAWCSAAVAAGVSGADDFFCFLGRSVNTAIETVRSDAEFARSKLRSLRATLHAAVEARCNELEEEIVGAEASKVVQLERQLCAVDAVVENLRACRGAVIDAVTLGDDELEKRYPDLMARRKLLEAEILALPTAVVEPPHVQLLVDTSELLYRIDRVGQVVAPHPVIADQLHFAASEENAADAALVARPGAALRVLLALKSNSRPDGESAESRKAALEAAASSALVKAVVTFPDSTVRRVHVSPSVGTDAGWSAGITITVDVPPDTLYGSTLSFQSATVHGCPVEGFESLTARIRGALAPSTWSAGKQKHGLNGICFGPDGHFYVGDQGCVRVVNSAGVEQRRLNAGFSDAVRWVVCATFKGSHYVIAANMMGELRALDPDSGELRWSAPSTSMYCAGLAVLPKRGLLICGMRGSETLFAYSLCDGRVAGSCCVRLDEWIAADASTDAVFCNVLRDNQPEGQQRVVVRTTWSNGRFSAFTPVWRTHATSSAGWPLAVVPRSRAAAAPHLVIVHQPGYFRPHKRTFRVVSLGDNSERELRYPDLALNGNDAVIGFAADAFGEVFVVWDRDAARPTVHVLKWPL